MAIQKEKCRAELREAVRQLRERGLYTAAKWAAEQLVGIQKEEEEEEKEKENWIVTPSPAFVRADRRSSGKSSSRMSRFGVAMGGTPSSALPVQSNCSSASPATRNQNFESPCAGLPVSDMESDRYMLAKSYFDIREYRRAAFVLQDTHGNKAFFLRCYSLYLAGEKRKEEELIELGGPLSNSNVENSELLGLEQELSRRYKVGKLDAFGMYLYGLVLKQRGKSAAARDVLINCVDAYPWNWSAWLELQGLCRDLDTLNSLEFRQHWMKDFFIASTLLELQKNYDGIEKYVKLQEVFLDSEYIMGQIASGYYNLQVYDEAEAIYADLLRYDPYRLDGMDIYSNILYVKESCATLSYLAHKAVTTDKYRPESCCIIGNYYSLKGQHGKAVLYFRRALKLNKNYLSAWTLIGHEYVELRNTPAAVDAYRRAVEINPRDYRAWYGLGQTYEILALPYYSLYYYRQSVKLRPDDARMWIAMGNCYESEQLQMYDDAIKCYIRALKNNDTEGIAVHKLAKIHQEIGRDDEAARYYHLNLDRMEKEHHEGLELNETLFFLANYYKQRKETEKSQKFCLRLLDCGGPEKHNAKYLLRELRGGDIVTTDLEQTTL